MVQWKNWNLAYQKMGDGEAVIEGACKGNVCVEESKYNAGCLLGILDPKAPTSHKAEMANEQWKNPVATRWHKITHSSDKEFIEEVDDIGLNLTVYTQSPNSPDTNILDLGFFRAILSFNDDCPANEEELTKSVEKAYGEYPMCMLNLVWLTLQSCFNMIIENDGGNDYKIPHMGKESLERRGLLPRVLDITPTANAWLNPTMEDDLDQDSDDSDDDVHVPTTTATPMVEMDGEGGENTATDAITNTGI